MSQQLLNVLIANAAIIVGVALVAYADKTRRHDTTDDDRQQP